MLPAWLLWLLPVPLATLGAVAWGSWAGRARGPEEPADTVRAYERFRDAMAAPVPPVVAPDDAPRARRRARD